MTVCGYGVHSFTTNPPILCVVLQLYPRDSIPSVFGLHLPRSSSFTPLATVSIPTYCSFADILLFNLEQQDRVGTVNSHSEHQSKALPEVYAVQAHSAKTWKLNTQRSDHFRCLWPGKERSQVLKNVERSRLHGICRVCHK